MNNNSVVVRNDEVRTAVSEAAQKWGERLANLGEALSQFAQAVAASLTSWLKAVVEVGRKLYDVLWQQYISQGAVYGRSHQGMMKWLGGGANGGIGVANTASKVCECGCCHVPDYGACDEFEEGSNGRCVYCDHGQQCHPGQGEFHNGPLAPVRRQPEAV